MVTTAIAIWRVLKRLLEEKGVLPLNLESVKGWLARKRLAAAAIADENVAARNDEVG